MGFALNGMNKYSNRLRSESTRIQSQGQQIAVEAAEYGAELMRKNILMAVTRTGQERARTGGSPGRYDTGKMYKAIQVGQPRPLTKGVSITFGWGVNGEPVEPYYFYQENGFGNVPPMHALLDSLVRTREYFYARLKETL